MEQGKVVALDDTIALQAAKISLELKLPMADSLILLQQKFIGQAYGLRIKILNPFPVFNTFLKSHNLGHTFHLLRNMQFLLVNANAFK
ncbi:hypothetical protein KAR34_02250 [bacterium]|nr:hypothetical protein [bacterium]